MAGIMWAKVYGFRQKVPARGLCLWCEHKSPRKMSVKEGDNMNLVSYESANGFSRRTNLNKDSTLLDGLNESMTPFGKNPLDKRLHWFLPAGFFPRPCRRDRRSRPSSSSSPPHGNRKLYGELCNSGNRGFEPLARFHSVRIFRLRSLLLSIVSYTILCSLFVQLQQHQDTLDSIRHKATSPRLPYYLCSLWLSSTLF
ncbi:Uncharacterized protein Rs2_21409 [Raphanus sativus]|nr:Uncharacterized protein Rs2_21409 [Raphanus sativus]